MNLLLHFFYIPDHYKTQEMCDRFISDDPFSLRYIPEKYKTQQMFHETVDDFLPTLNFVFDWFVTSKMIKKLFTALYADQNMQILVMFCLIIMKWVYLTIINLTRMILVLLFMSDFWLGILNLKNAKYLEKRVK